MIQEKQIEVLNKIGSFLVDLELIFRTTEYNTQIEKRQKLIKKYLEKATLLISHCKYFQK